MRMSGAMEREERDVERKHTCGGSKGNARVPRKITPLSLRCSLSIFPLIQNGGDDTEDLERNQHLTVRGIKINIKNDFF